MRATRPARVGVFFLLSLDQRSRFRGRFDIQLYALGHQDRWFRTLCDQIGYTASRGIVALWQRGRIVKTMPDKAVISIVVGLPKTQSKSQKPSLSFQHARGGTP